MARSRTLPRYGPYGMRRKGKFEESKHRRVKGRFAQKPDVEPQRMRLGSRMVHVSMDDPGVQRRREAVREEARPEVEPMIAAMAPPTPQKRVAEISLREGTLTKEAWDNHFGEFTPQAFAEQIADNLPNGVTVSMHAVAVYSPEAELDPRLKPGVDISMVFERDGRFIADASRHFHRKGDELHVIHTAFHVERKEQSKGLGKRFLRNSMAAYRQLGVSMVTARANIDVGGYAWAKYGFSFDPKARQFPADYSWTMEAHDQMDLVRDQLDEETRTKLAALITSVERTPHNIWQIADMKEPVVMDKGRSTERVLPLGKAILMRTEWPAELRLDDELAMARFNAYVNKGGEGGEQAQDTVDSLPVWAMDGRSEAADAVSRATYGVVTSQATQDDADFLAFADLYAKQNEIDRDMAVAALFPGWQTATTAERKRAARRGWYG